jgi:hypothetical protein
MTALESSFETRELMVENSATVTVTSEDGFTVSG